MAQLKIIAISGASGSGKSALIKELAALLGCGSLHFDDFIDAGTYPADMAFWLAQGADVNLIQTPRFTEALQQAKADAAQSADGPSYLLLEEPFGRQRLAMASLIDAVVLLCPPADICLSRVIQRNLSAVNQASATEADLNKAIVQINNYLRRYDDYLGLAYQTTVAQVATNCDLQINDVAPFSQIAARVLQWLALDQQRRALS
ncbi:hypothetical protein [Rheinheimera sp.]|mgnify:CR=1 FL=1|uniref:hypothetical protein n=1 Tax=Rheinheimera sp. TaxID=1869214 RepID=UPI002FDCE389